MKNFEWMRHATTLAAMALVSIACNDAHPADNPQEKRAVTHHAKGTFDVKVTPQENGSGDPSIGRFALDKTFHGDLEGSSRGEMLGSQGPVAGSGGYVAIERVTGTLQGRRGSFLLQHNGTMRAGAFQMNVVILPDSGTDELKGIAGKMTIIIEGGTHRYELDYSIEQ